MLSPLRQTLRRKSAEPPLPHAVYRGSLPQGGAAILPLPAQLNDPSLLKRCLLLAVLLHVLLVLVFGSAPGGTARPGEGVLGRLNVVLRTLAPGPSTSEGEPLPQQSTRGSESATTPRHGGRVQPSKPSPTPETPGEAQLGQTAPRINTRTLGAGAPESGRVAPLADVARITPVERPLDASQRLSEPLPNAAVAAVAARRLASETAAAAPLQASKLEAQRRLELPELSSALPAAPPRTSTLAAPETLVTRAPKSAALESARLPSLPAALNEALPAPTRLSTLAAPSAEQSAQTVRNTPLER
ncbi:MAG TPA: hypothetical protein VGE47_15685, partial [Burkholderiaceae bacterium]